LKKGSDRLPTKSPRFDELLEMIDRLSVDERANLMQVVAKRLALDERRRIAKSVHSARREHAAGKTSPTNPEELMREILIPT
jgi:DNA-directed RNA polymerase subunit K/omega